MQHFSLFIIFAALLSACGKSSREADCAAFSAAWGSAGPMNSAADYESIITRREAAINRVLSKDAVLRKQWEAQVGLLKQMAEAHRKYELTERAPKNMPALVDRNESLARVATIAQKGFVETNTYCAQ
jgi:hypothetical protein